MFPLVLPYCVSFAYFSSYAGCISFVRIEGSVSTTRTDASPMLPLSVFSLQAVSANTAAAVINLFILPSKVFHNIKLTYLFRYPQAQTNGSLLFH
jgi:hypothetical protein